jgi:hypothetical protein
VVWACSKIIRSARAVRARRVKNTWKWPCPATATPPPHRRPTNPPRPRALPAAFSLSFAFLPVHVRRRWEWEGSSSSATRLVAAGDFFFQLQAHPYRRLKKGIDSCGQQPCLQLPNEWNRTMHTPCSFGLSASSTFISEQISHQQPTSCTFLSEQISTSHQTPAKRTVSVPFTVSRPSFKESC